MRARNHVHSQYSIQTHECAYQATLTMRKTTLTLSSRVKRFIQRALKATFHIEERGKPLWFLGHIIRREVGKFAVDQECYLETMLGRFQIDQCKPSGPPANWISNLQLQKKRRQKGGLKNP